MKRVRVYWMGFYNPFTVDEIIANIPPWGTAVKLIGAQVTTMADVMNIS